jgi:cytochrome P450
MDARSHLPDTSFDTNSFDTDTGNDAMHGTLAAAVKQAAAEEARQRAYALPLDKIDVSDPELYRTDTHWPYFERLRKEAPIHYCAETRVGAYWSVTKYNDIMSVDTNHSVFSSDIHLGGIGIQDVKVDYRKESFIAMDNPRHADQRKTVQPLFLPENLDQLAQIIRTRACMILDDLPRNETFNWVDRVSVELTTQMLATIFDFPFEERRKLTRWSNVATAAPGNREIIASEKAREAELQECLAYFMELWKERAKQPQKIDLLSMMAHSGATKDMTPDNLLGNLILLIVGGNDTTRNSLSGSVYALSQFPDQDKKLRENPALIDSFVPEVIRWQTPLTHMRRTALMDTELGGKTIKKGEKVVMWYVSGNRDDEVIDRPNEFIIDRARPRNHLSFGFGVHRCLGLRLAELQLRITWEEILKRFPTIEVVEEPKRTYSNFVKGYEILQVRIPA